MYYNRNDRKVLLWLLCLLVACCVAFFLLQRSDIPVESLSNGDDSTFVFNSGSRQNSRYKNGYGDGRHPNANVTEEYLHKLEALDNIHKGVSELFYFDPNTASADELLRLGLKPWQVRNLLKYRIRGGKFRNPEDFGKLYGLSARQYKTLLPYIKIDNERFVSASEVIERSAYKKEYASRDTFQRQHKISLGETIDISTADTTALKTVPGIGGYFARKIVRYRNELGGYVSVDQLDEIPDFPTDAKKFLIVKTVAVRKIYINKVSLVQLRKHPYIGFLRAKTIIDHRHNHKRIRSLQDLSYSKYFSEETIKRLEPYITEE